MALSRSEQIAVALAVGAAAGFWAAFLLPRRIEISERYVAEIRDPSARGQ